MQSATTRVHLFLFVFLLCTALASAQTGGTGGSTGGSTGGGTTGGSTGTGTGTSTTTGRTPTTVPSQTPQLQRDVSRPIFLSGAVLMDDGTPATHGIYIERVCSGRIFREGVTDSTGHFSIQVGRDLMLYQDASTDNSNLSGFGRQSSSSSDPFGSATGLGSSNSDNALIGCELRAAAPGFRSSTIDLSMHRSMDSPEVGPIVLDRMEKVQGTSLSVISAKGPKEAKKAYERGMAAAKKGKDAEAQQEWQKAIEIYPQHAAAWEQLGLLQLKQEHLDEARADMNKALAADPKFVEPYVHLAYVAAQQRNWKETVEFSDKALALDPLDYPQAYFFNAVGNLNLGQLENAEKSARRAKLRDSRHKMPQLDRLIGSILMAKKDYDGAINSLKAYVGAQPNASDANLVREQLATLERMKV